MEDTNDKQEHIDTKSSLTESTIEAELSSDRTMIDTDSLEHAEQAGTAKNEEDSIDHVKNVDDDCKPSMAKETIATGTKVKRKIRSTRRKLNAMINNTSLHFSDTDSEGELTTINSQVPILNNKLDREQRPVIAVTFDDSEMKNSDLLFPDDKSLNQPSNFVENLTDVDEIYASEQETEQKDDKNSLKITESRCQGDTDLEDFEGEDEIHSTIYVKARSDIFCDYSGETVATKEGDGPFSVEVRNKMYLEEIPRNQLYRNMPDIAIVCETDEEDVDISEEEEIDEACCSQKEIFDDMDVLAASQIFMKNIDKSGNMLGVKDASDDAISDCHTDVEDIDPIE